MGNNTSSLYNFNSLEIVFENTDAVTLKPEHIKYLSMDHIRRKAVIQGRQCDYSVITSLEMKISKDAKNCVADFGAPAFMRIMQYPDITQLRFYGLDGEGHSYFVAWMDESTDENREGQKMYINSVGDMRVAIRSDSNGSFPEGFDDVKDWFKEHTIPPGRLKKTES